MDLKHHCLKVYYSGFELAWSGKISESELFAFCKACQQRLKPEKVTEEEKTLAQKDGCLDVWTWREEAERLIRVLNG